MADREARTPRWRYGSAILLTAPAFGALAGVAHRTFLLPLFVVLAVAAIVIGGAIVGTEDMRAAFAKRAAIAKRRSKDAREEA